MSSDFPDNTGQLAILVSGGIDSAVLVGESLERYDAVYPLYVRCGLYWEAVELNHLHDFLEAISRPALKSLHILEMPVTDLYAAHWSLIGTGTPDADTPDEAVYLPGRNVLLLSKAMIWCHLRGIPVVALAPLESNPFPDATPAFFRAYQDVVNQAISGAVQVVQPYLGLSKAEVLHRGRNLPLERTFSCIRPVGGKHCGACNKCAERHRAFITAGLPDRTLYSPGSPCTA